MYAGMHIAYTPHTEMQRYTHRDSLIDIHSRIPTGKHRDTLTETHGNI